MWSILSAMDTFYESSKNCPACLAYNSLKNILISNNILSQKCEKCSYTKGIPLPELNKKIIYLDQQFLSNIFKNKDERFVHAGNLIAQLANEQLLVCPYSDIHEIETYLWNDEDKINLRAFLKKSAHGHQFKDRIDIKRNQLLKAVKAYLNETDIKNGYGRVLMCVLTLLMNKKSNSNVFSDFYGSEYFSNIPFVRLTAIFYTFLRKRIRNGFCKNLAKAKHNLSGIWFDIEFLSVYGPYCDAVFTDNFMRDMLSEASQKYPCDFRFKVFSAANFEEFEKYLEGIAKCKTPFLEDYLNLVYG